MAKNSNQGGEKKTTAKTVKKTKPKTNRQDGLFTEGGKGGPGRGNKKPHAIDGKSFWETCELVIRQGLKSQNPELKLKYLGHYLKFKDLKLKAEAKGSGETKILDSQVQELLGDVVNGLLAVDHEPFEEDDFFDD